MEGIIFPVDDLGRAVDVAAADPRRGHGEDADKHANVPPGEHDLLLRERSYQRGWRGLLGKVSSLPKVPNEISPLSAFRILQ